MKLNLKSLLLCVGLAATASAVAQQPEGAVQGFVHEQSSADGYVLPTDTAVLRKLDNWQDLKFGVLFHFGLYSVPGIVVFSVTGYIDDILIRFLFQKQDP